MSYVVCFTVKRGACTVTSEVVLTARTEKGARSKFMRMRKGGRLLGFDIRDSQMEFQL
jgi:hypothetical protein